MTYEQKQLLVFAYLLVNAVLVGREVAYYERHRSLTTFLVMSFLSATCGAPLLVIDSIHRVIQWAKRNP